MHLFLSLFSFLKLTVKFEIIAPRVQVAVSHFCRPLPNPEDGIANSHTRTRRHGSGGCRMGESSILGVVGGGTISLNRTDANQAPLSPGYCGLSRSPVNLRRTLLRPLGLSELCRSAAAAPRELNQPVSRELRAAPPAWHSVLDIATAWRWTQQRRLLRRNIRGAGRGVVFCSTVPFLSHNGLPAFVLSYFDIL